MVSQTVLIALSASTDVTAPGSGTSIVTYYSANDLRCDVVTGGRARASAKYKIGAATPRRAPFYSLSFRKSKLRKLETLAVY